MRASRTHHHFRFPGRCSSRRSDRARRAPPCPRPKGRSRRSGRSPGSARGASISRARRDRAGGTSGAAPAPACVRPLAIRRPSRCGGVCRCRAGCRPRSRRRAFRCLEAPPVLERAELHLVDHRRLRGLGMTCSSSLDAEVGHADRPSVTEPLSTFHSGPGPGRTSLGPVDDVEVELVDPEPLQAALRFGDRVGQARVELRGDEHVLPRHTALSQRRARRSPRCRTPVPCRCGGSPAPEPIAPRRHTPDRRGPAIPRDRAAGSGCHRKALVCGCQRPVDRPTCSAPRLAHRSRWPPLRIRLVLNRSPGTAGSRPEPPGGRGRPEALHTRPGGRPAA